MISLLQHMLQHWFLTLASLGIGVWVGLLFALGIFFFGKERSDKVQTFLMILVGVVAWVATIKLQMVFPQPLWLWGVCIAVCCVLDIVAWIFFQMIFRGGE